MRWIAEVDVQLRPGIADPEGLTVAGGLRALDLPRSARCAAASCYASALRPMTSRLLAPQVESMCRRLLANPVMEIATWEVRADDEPSEEARLA